MPKPSKLAQAAKRENSGSWRRIQDLANGGRGADADYMLAPDSPKHIYGRAFARFDANGSLTVRRGSNRIQLNAAEAVTSFRRLPSR